MFLKAAAILIGFGASCLAQPLGPAAAEFQKSVMPVLSARCTACHSDQLKMGNLSLEQFRDPALGPQKTEIWQKVRERITAGTMPPAPSPAPSKAETAAVLRWIDGLIGRAEVRTVDPGRGTARRLNRVEYNNTIRDLFGVTIR